MTDLVFDLYLLAAALGLVPVVAFAGLPVLSQSAFLAVGAIGAMQLERAGLPIGSAVLLSIVAGGCAGRADRLARGGSAGATGGARDLGARVADGRGARRRAGPVRRDAGPDAPGGGSRGHAVVRAHAHTHRPSRRRARPDRRRAPDHRADPARPGRPRRDRDPRGPRGGRGARGADHAADRLAARARRGVRGRGRRRVHAADRDRRARRPVTAARAAAVRSRDRRRRRTHRRAAARARGDRRESRARPTCWPRPASRRRPRTAS